MSQRPAVIFDFGNVIAFFDYRIATGKVGARLGLSAEETLVRLQGRGFDDLMKLYESGLMTSAQFASQVTGWLNLSMTLDEFAADWEDIFQFNDSILPVIDHFQSRGMTLAIGSNTSEIHARYFRRRFASIIDRFDHLVLSYQVGHLKPSAEFYEKCVRAVGRSAEDCIFIDDLAVNVEGAARAGLRPILYRSTEELLAAIIDAEKIA